MSVKKNVQKKLSPIKMNCKSHESITLDECLGMYELFKVYYQNTPFEQFFEDFSNKIGVHIAKRKYIGGTAPFLGRFSFGCCLSVFVTLPKRCIGF